MHLRMHAYECVFLVKLINKDMKKETLLNPCSVCSVYVCVCVCMGVYGCVWVCSVVMGKCMVCVLSLCLNVSVSACVWLRRDTIWHH